MTITQDVRDYASDHRLPKSLNQQLECYKKDIRTALLMVANTNFKECIREIADPTNPWHITPTKTEEIKRIQLIRRWINKKYRRKLNYSQIIDQRIVIHGAEKHPTECGRNLSPWRTDYEYEEERTIVVRNIPDKETLRQFRRKKTENKRSGKYANEIGFRRR